MLLLASLMLTACGEASRTYDADCSTPPAIFGLPKDGVGHELRTLSIQVHRAGALTWGGRAVTDEQMSNFAHEVGEFVVPPLLVLEVDPLASCARVEEVRAILMAAPICKTYHWCSEGRDPKSWPHWPNPPGVSRPLAIERTGGAGARPRELETGH